MTTKQDTLKQITSQIEAKAKATEAIPDPDPWFRPVTPATELAECQKCAAVIQDHADAIKQHRDWHEAYD